MTYLEIVRRAIDIAQQRDVQVNAEWREWAGRGRWVYHLDVLPLRRGWGYTAWPDGSACVTVYGDVGAEYGAEAHP